MHTAVVSRGANGLSAQPKVVSKATESAVSKATESAVRISRKFAPRDGHDDPPVWLAKLEQPLLISLWRIEDTATHISPTDQFERVPAFAFTGVTRPESARNLVHI